MKSTRIDTVASAVGGSRSRGGLPTICKALLVASTLAAGALMAGPAGASSVSIITNGTIGTGSDPTGVLGQGVGATLNNDSYSMLVEFDGLGPNYFTNGSGTSAMDLADPLTGFVTVSVNGGTPFTSDITTSLGAFLAEDLFDLSDSNSGTDAAGDFTSVSQDVAGASAFVPYADLQTAFSYALQNGDFGLDSYLYTDAAADPSTFFTGTPTSIELLVPEPDTWALLATGLLGLGLLVRRRRA